MNDTFHKNKELITSFFLQEQKMATVPLNEVDIKTLIKLSWKQLGILFTGLTPKESNQTKSLRL